MTQRDNKYITKDMIHIDSIEGNYFADNNAVKLDYQNGTIDTVLFCDAKEFDIDDESEYPYIEVLGQIYKNNIPTMNQYLQQEDC